MLFSITDNFISVKEAKEDLLEWKELLEILKSIKKTNSSIE